ncbi:hypothetical protein H072_2451 [Dactylellina haptotyla CBS 200.50]|uniref:Uncharacterized protein n=1 Tax=Dactylellina haptotyla (strain CBS 200.50) TaxID=1284197 RepID=S8ARG4_DACHA|nr:hypothetical protein H072_2451 [Dactylellina haptotyla CBS 200.50]
MAASVSLAQARPLAPVILRPKQKTGDSGYTVQFLEERAFSAPYYLRKTNNWRYTKLGPLLREMKTCAGEAFQKNKRNIHDWIGNGSLAEQGDDVIEQTYRIFLDELAKAKANTDMEDDYYALILDLLASTENFGSSGRKEKLWLYLRCTAESKRARKKQAERDARKECSLEDPSSPGTAGEAFAPSTGEAIAPSQPRVRSRGLEIRDRKNLLETCNT